MNSNNMISSSSVRTLIDAYEESHPDELPSPGQGLNLNQALLEMVKVSLHIYDPTYIEESNIQDLIGKVLKHAETLSLAEVNLLIEALDARLFLGFIERQLDTPGAEAWNKGVAHALEVRSHLDRLQVTIGIVADTAISPLLGQKNT